MGGKQLAETFILFICLSVSTRVQYTVYREAKQLRLAGFPLLLAPAPPAFI